MSQLTYTRASCGEAGNMDSSTTENTPVDNVTVGKKLAPYNPTNVECVHMALSMLSISPTDVLYDLGCGDGRLLVEASRMHNIRSIGIEYDSSLCERARMNAEAAGLSEKIEIIHANVVDVDIDDATAIFVYLVPEGMRAMKDTLVGALRRGCRIVTYVFSIPDLSPTETTVYKKSTKLYYYAPM